MLFADEAFDILGFSKEEKYNIYKVTNIIDKKNILKCNKVKNISDCTKTL